MSPEKHVAARVVFLVVLELVKRLADGYYHLPCLVPISFPVPLRQATFLEPTKIYTGNVPYHFCASHVR